MTQMGLVNLLRFARLFDCDQGVDWRTLDLTALEMRAKSKWCGQEPETVLPLLKAYQRILRILPVGEELRALPLLESGLHSAVQIANLPRDEFVRRWGELFPGEDALGRTVHDAALSRRSALLLHYVNNVQRNEPHYRAARFK